MSYIQTPKSTKCGFRFLVQNTCVVPIDSVRPHPQNVNKGNLEVIAESFQANGFYRSIVVQQSTGYILAGNHCHRVAKELGATEIPVTFITVDDPTALRILLADNRATRLGLDDSEALADLLQAIQQEVGTLVGTGFDNAALQDLLDELGRESGGLTEPDSVPDPPKEPASRSGDLYVLGPHLVMCGDATNSNDIARVLEGHRANLALTDPPYGVNYVGKTPKKLAIKNDDLGPEFYDFLHTACKNILAVTKGAIYICTSSSHLHTLFRAFTDAGGHWSTYIVWAKNTFTLGWSDYQRQSEHILYGWPNGTDHYWCGDRNQGDVWFVDKPVVNDMHPTMKPVELVQKAIRNSSQSGDLVFDPFGGSGSTLIACEMTGRRARILELDPRYVDVIVKRWQDHTGKNAVLEGDGRNFNEIALERAQAKE